MERRFNKPRGNVREQRNAEEFANDRQVQRFLQKLREEKGMMENKLQKYEESINFLFSYLTNDKRDNTLYITVIDIFCDPTVVNDNHDERRFRNWSRFYYDDKFCFENKFNEMVSDPDAHKHAVSLIRLMDSLAIALPEKKNLILKTAKKFQRHYLLLRIEDIDTKFVQLIDRITNSVKPDSVIPLMFDIYPNSQAINSDLDVDKLKNMFRTGWESIEQFKETISRIASEDFLISIKNGLKDLKAGTLDYRDLYLYENVMLSSKKLEIKSPIGITAILDFKVKWPKGYKPRSTVKWSYQDRLNYGSLLLLSKNDNCLTIDAIAISKARADSRNPKERAFFEKTLSSGTLPVMIVKGVVEPMKTYYMFEANKWWSAIEPFLKALQTLNETTFPISMVGPLINHDFSVNNGTSIDQIDIAPLFKLPMRGQMMMPISRDRPLGHLSDSNIDMTLYVDHQQLSPLWFSLKNKITLVNGGPGTGKTHFAREVVKCLYKNNFPGPIIVIAYTNHSVDAFLEGIIEHVDKEFVLRHGGPIRTKNETIIARNVNPKMLIYPSNYFSFRRQAIEGSVQILLLNQQLALCTSLIDQLEKIGPSNGILANIMIVDLMISVFKCVFDQPGSIIKKIRAFSYKKNSVLRSLVEKEDKSIWELWIFGKEFVINKYKSIDNGKSYENPFGSLDNKNNKDLIKSPEEEKPFVPIIFPNSDSQYDNEIDNEEENRKLDNDLLFDFENNFLVDGENEIIDMEKILEWIKRQFEILLAEPEFDIIKTIDITKAILLHIKKLRDDLSRSLENALSEMNSLEKVAYASLYQRMRIIGMTATIAAAYKEALLQSGCRYMIIEEAGELTEVMTTSIIPSSLRHLVLVGDYNQLRPKVEHEMTRDPINFDISTFERLVRFNQIMNINSLFTLTIQRRMHPDISRIIRSVFCHDMIDDPSTNERRIALGCVSRVSFILHNKKEDRTRTSTRSHSNDYEARYIASLCFFFMSRGFKAKDITVVSLYKGQMYNIQRHIVELYEKLKHKLDIKAQQLFGDKGTHEIKVVVLDNYQGEENEIIIVSIVRSDTLGFVKNRNRALVTLSRARCMMVVIGYRELLTQSKYSEIWPLVIAKAREFDEYSVTEGDKCGLYVTFCEKHSDIKSGSSRVLLSQPEDFIEYRLSYCDKQCDFIYDCGHKCSLRCHYGTHDGLLCVARCQHTCEHGHQCKGKCGECQKYGHPPCKTSFEYEFPECGHRSNCICDEVTKGIAECRYHCEKQLTCGHKCSLNCSHKGLCKCNGIGNVYCENCGNNVETKCGECMDEHHRCNFRLECGHLCQGFCDECTKNGNHKSCNEDCTFTFYPCNHKCKHKCNEGISEMHQHFFCQECEKARVQPKTIEYHCETCNHKSTVDHQSIPKSSCRHQCTRKCKKCGAPCYGLVGEPCIIYCKHYLGIKQPPFKEPPLLFMFPCGHIFKFSEAEKYVTEFFEKVFRQVGPDPTPLCRISCPECSTELLESWAFSREIFLIEEALEKIRILAANLIEDSKNNKCLDDDLHPNDRLLPYRCQCGKLFYSKYYDISHKYINCKFCGYTLSS